MAANEIEALVLRQRARHLPHRPRLARGDVERAGRVGGQRQQVRPGDVAHVDEVAQLAAVLEDAGSAAGGER